MKIHKRLVILSTSTAITLLIALLSGDPVQAADYQCTGSVGAIHVNNLVVPANASCTINGAIMDGDITVGTNATLLAINVQVHNNIHVNGAASVQVSAGSSVGGDVQISSSNTADIQYVTIHNNLVLNGNRQPVNAANNAIGHDLQANNNTGGVSINANTIHGNLQCKGNNPAPTGAGDLVSGSMQDQCANFGQNLTPTPIPTTNPAPTTTPAVDTAPPTVQWISPVPDGGVYDVRGGVQVLLQANAQDNVSIQEVGFYRWDAITVKYILIGILQQAPYEIQIDASVLNPQWNEVCVLAVDTSGNRSGCPYIWLYKLGGGNLNGSIFLPMIGR